MFEYALHHGLFFGNNSIVILFENQYDTEPTIYGLPHSCRNGLHPCRCWNCVRIITEVEARV